jgi:hypothetical protein
MGTFTVRRFTPQEFALVLAEVTRRNEELVKNLATDAGRALQRGGLLIQARAQEKIVEKGHVVTGSLLRSINTRPESEREGRISVLVGSFMFYAPFVENLPDGGYLNEAAEERFQDVVNLMAREGVEPALKRWAR